MSPSELVGQKHLAGRAGPPQAGANRCRVGRMDLSASSKESPLSASRARTRASEMGMGPEVPNTENIGALVY